MGLYESDPFDTGDVSLCASIMTYGDNHKQSKKTLKKTVYNIKSIVLLSKDLIPERK